MRMQFQIWIAGLAMGVDMKTRAQRVRKRNAKTVSPAPRKSKSQQTAVTAEYLESEREQVGCGNTGVLRLRRLRCELLRSG